MRRGWLDWERRPWDGEDGGRKFAQEHECGLFAKGAAAELPALGLDRRLRPAESTNDQGEAGFCEIGKPKKTLDGRDLLMEVSFVAIDSLRLQ